MSGILYPILILTLFLVVQILTMMASRKTVLDKNKQQLLDSVNASNKVYNNEELSILLSEQQDKINALEGTLSTVKNSYDTLQKKYDVDIASLNSKIVTLQVMIEKEQHVATTYIGNLNTVTNKNESTIYFGPSAIGRPNADCQYGVVQNFSVGNSDNPEVSYWHFQLAFCTDTNTIFTRKRINSSSEGTWTSWYDH